ncbi:MAG: helix-turn-helix transcriptional regulator [Sphingopyxis sp.]|jgi:prophage regulatory protein|uniref:helix-turn-helix transcriptional regulator n=1 Tax=unclassified Sphingopyxis TaxID=2614943 RepID=UPI0009796304|nr:MULTISPECIES: AlpA family transcriptional regulator [unclassified Sphingopyxis]APZ97555.1 DNA-binding protein [Sphingopyxis sp. QXT-31]QNO27724.1 AlpA family transcriptional regulator [Sphingopyxis sp. OPL5]
MSGGTDRLVRLPTVISRTGLSRSTIYEKIAEGTFPKQIRLSKSSVGWRESQLDQWIEDPPSYRADI